MTCPETFALGAYVLGALDTAERLETEVHLRDCTRCRDELLQFAPLPGLLHTLTIDDLAALETEPDPSPALRPPPPAPRRRTGWILAAAAAIVLALGAALLARQLLPDAESAVTWTATNGVDGIDTTAVMTDQPWGTDIQLHMKDLQPGQNCKLLVHSRTGASEVTGWWATAGYDQADVPASTSIPLADIDHLEVVTADNTVLITLTNSTR
ncbi:putative zinc finger protein [Kribbella sp. VKM Ac-2527]|uniref:Putative zinc finger protein n=1 Tax=Kribbella caucasensis TaxID=2512215 RepID=A0A4R6JNW8_9ACTN|nr:zf-HC2 domain-containing protein [Kribbella sp. VKM Ac-2527]TDO36315.1 putative zinc finger protein [Kribbella sp. VKM Ac-2527]